MCEEFGTEGMTGRIAQLIIVDTRGANLALAAYGRAEAAIEHTFEIRGVSNEPASARFVIARGVLSAPILTDRTGAREEDRRDRRRT